MSKKNEIGLEPEVAELLHELVAAWRELPRERRSDFAFVEALTRTRGVHSRDQVEQIWARGESVSFDGKLLERGAPLPAEWDRDLVRHAGLPGGQRYVIASDIDALHQHGLIEFRPGTSHFILTPAGLTLGTPEADAVALPVAAPLPPYKPEDQPWFGPLSITEVTDISEFIGFEPDVVLLTAVEVERNAALRLMMPIDGRKSITEVLFGPDTYYLGRLGEYTVALTLSEAGSVGRGGSILTTSDAIRTWNPKAVIALGFGFGMQPGKQQFGDVLVSRKVFIYEPQRVESDRAIQRGPIPEASQTLVNRIRNVTTWRFERPDGSPCTIVDGGILSGEKLVDDIGFREELRRTYPEARGGEMEGAGLYAAADRLNVDWILVKGIADWGDGTKDKIHQALASAAAASLVAHILSKPGALSGLARRERHEPEAASKQKIDEIGHQPRELSGVEELERAGALDALVSRNDELPYASMGSKGRGPLSNVYVERRLEGEVVSGGWTPMSTPSPAVAMRSLEEALARHEHLLIDAPAGLGKSTLLRRLAGRTYTALKSGQAVSFVPIHVKARGLASSTGSLANRLSGEVSDDLGMRLVSALDPAIFERSPLDGHPWLILIDGLDEIVDPRAREELVRSIQALAKTAPERYRFVITTRPLETDEAFDENGWGVYALPPFDQSQIEAFASLWFATDPDTAAAFLRAVADRRLSDLATNPLVLTLLAIIFENSSGAELPSGRAELFEHFVRILLVEEEAERGTREQFRSEWDRRYGSNGRDWGEQVFDSRRDLLASLAEIALTRREPPTIRDAIRHARLSPGIDKRVDDAWLAEQLATLIERTGIATVSHGEVIFAHRSFAEFLMASAIASKYDPSTFSPKSLAPAAGDDVLQEVYLHLFGIWTLRGLACTEHVTWLRSRGVKGIIVAGTALVENAIMTAAEAESVTDALLSVARQTNLNETLLQNQALELLGRLRGNGRAAKGLLAIVRDEGIPEDRRGTAAAQLAVLGHVEDLLHILGNPETPPYVQMFAGTYLAENGMASEVIDALLPVVRDRARPSHRRWDVNKALIKALCDDGSAFLASDPRTDSGVRQVAILALRERREPLARLAADETLPIDVRQGALGLIEEL